MLNDGLYEKLISKALDSELHSLGEEKLIKTEPIDDGEASKILSDYVVDVIRQGLDNLIDNGGKLENQIELVNTVVNTIESFTKEDAFNEMTVADRAELLLALFRKKNSVFALNPNAEIIRPETSIASSSLFTGSVHEPQMFSELKKEIVYADRIDMLVSFIKWSGLRLIIDELSAYTNNGGRLRVITTSYMGATDYKAIEELSKLPNTQIKISYDTKRTRLHAKTYVFHRNSGYTTAYIGSSNLSNAAISSGLEWNVKATRNDLPETIDKIEATFETYWNSDEFTYYNDNQCKRLQLALNAEKHKDSSLNYAFMDVKPYPYQQEILDNLEAERTVRGKYHNLVVAATGTGKTVISAFDYLNFRKKNPKSANRLLFIAHREEILKQSLLTFRAVLKDNNFGELFVGNYSPAAIDYLFMSIQTFNSQEFIKKTDADYYDYIIVDEFHHAAASSYQALLSYYKPRILLGLTATPERMDGKSILKYFDNRFAAEIRLPEAIDRKLLCPFQYFGISDTVDLDTLTWRNGGYDRTELSNIYTLNALAAKKRADMIVASLYKYITDIDDVKGLGFCVSIQHANYMADFFNRCGIKSIALTGNSSDSERDNAKKILVKGDIRFIFVVDIYNEGVDIPEVNTVLFLRPTESLTIFLQQLGRGLRLSDGKDCLTVLDFIGQANKHYRFDEKFEALLSKTHHSIDREVKDGFVSLPKGCYIKLEKKAQKVIFDNITAAYGRKSGLVSRLEEFASITKGEVTLSAFCEYSHIDPRQIYKFTTFSRLCVNAGLREDFSKPLEEQYYKALKHFAQIDSRRWIEYILKVLTTDYTYETKKEYRMILMFLYTFWQRWSKELGYKSIDESINAIKANTILLSELIDLLKYRYNHIDFIDEPVELDFDCPLDVHSSYTRDQLLIALDFLKPNTVREGVKWLKDKKIDVLLNTLNKTQKDYSPSTMYHDYSINSALFHWQSQSTTSPTSPTGQRYINHDRQGSSVLLFVRENNEDAYGNTEVYTFLGKAHYVRHEGSRPMSIIWRLDKPIPARFLKKTNKLLAE